MPGAKPYARLSDFPRFTVRVPWLQADRLTALAERENMPLGLMLANAAVLYLAGQNAETLVKVEQEARRVQARRLAAAKMKNTKPPKPMAPQPPKLTPAEFDASMRTVVAHLEAQRPTLKP